MGDEKTVDEQRHDFVTERINKPELVQRWPEYSVRRKEISRIFEQARRDGTLEEPEPEPEPEPKGKSKGK